MLYSIPYSFEDRSLIISLDLLYMVGDIFEEENLYGFFLWFIGTKEIHMIYDTKEKAIDVRDKLIKEWEKVKINIKELK